MPTANASSNRLGGLGTGVHRLGIPIASLLAPALMACGSAATSTSPTAAKPHASAARPHPKPPAEAAPGDATVLPEPSADDLPKRYVDVSRNWKGMVCAAAATGHVVCWGRNDDGQLGDGTRIARGTPAAVAGLPKTVDVEVGERLVCALTSAGEVWCWGFDYRRGRHEGRPPVSPSPVEGIDDGATIAVGEAHACAIRDDGRLACWGSNMTGACGRKPAEETIARAKDVPGIEGATAVAAGDEITCVSLPGEVRCFGNEHLVANADELPPQRPVEGLADAKELTLAGRWLCARHDDDSVRCGWFDEPWPQERIVQHATSLASDGQNVCAVTEDGRGHCWGRCRHGVCAHQPTHSPEPSQEHDEAIGPVGGFEDLSSITPGCGVREGGQIWCWGPNLRTLPTRVKEIDGARKLWLESGGTCAVLGDREVRCWGLIRSGSDERVLLAPEPSGRVPAGAEPITRSGDRCLRRPDEALACEGVEPHWYRPLGSPVDLLSGDSFVYGLRRDGTVVRAFRRGNGRLGSVKELSDMSPATRIEWGPGDTLLTLSDNGTVRQGARDVLTDATQIVAERTHACAITRDDSLHCWGDNRYGELGTGDDEDQRAPTRVEGLEGVEDVAIASRRTCAIANGSKLYCWGEGTFGALGLDRPATESEGGSPDVHAPADTGLADVVDVEADSRRTCAVLADGSVWCFGQNRYGAFGDGTGWTTPWRALPP